MPITPLDAITFANQNMQVAASKQNDYRNRIESQKYALVAEMVGKETQVNGVDDLSEEQKIDEQREHNRQEAEEQTGEKKQETKIKKNPKTKVKVSEEQSASQHILDIKV